MKAALPRGRKILPAGVLVLVLGVSWPCGAVCSERPTVMLDERAAATHLLSSTDPELPVNLAWRGVTREVIVRVTVDRRGTICDLKALAGLRELRKPALEAVKKHWRYRPFLVDWKPVVVQFPVRVRFAPPKRERTRVTV